MNEPRAPENAAAGAAGPVTAGRLLREARQARGLHIAALAASIKVTTQKLDALENDRFDELPGATFTRALAQTVCRALKIDPAPVLVLMPPAAGKGLDRMSERINQPFRDRSGPQAARDFSALMSPAVIGAALLVLAALVVYLLPEGSFNISLPFGERVSETAEAEPVEAPVAMASEALVGPEAAASGVESALTVSPMIEAAHPAPPAEAGGSEPAPAASVIASNGLQLRTTGASWVEVKDRRGTTLFSRLMLAGESEIVAVDGHGPFRVTVGNASVTSLTYRGEPVVLRAPRGGQVAKLELP